MELSEFITYGIKSIQRGVVDRKSPYRLPVLSTSVEGNVSQRIVVARGFDEKNLQLIVFTDNASKKYQQLQINSKCALLFWDPRKKLQIQVNGKANFIKEKDMYWNNLSDRQKKEYVINPIPGSKIESAQSYNYDSEETRFAVLSIQFDHIDMLQLSSDGHKRAGCILRQCKREDFWMCP